VLSDEHRGSQELIVAAQTQRLDQLAKVIRSKNAGPFELTFDIMFDDPAAYEAVKKSGVINAKRIAEAYRVRVDDVLVCRPYDAAVAFKITIRRPVSSGDIEDRDVYGCQQHVPLTSIEVPALRAAAG
jgi:GTP cyclohydrolase III